MSKRYEFLIGQRYLRSNRGNRFVSFISTISMLGIAIGVAVLIVTFLAVLELARENLIEVAQQEAYSIIYVKLRSGHLAAVA